MLDIQDLTVRYGSGHNRLTAVDAVSVSVPTASTLGIVGESGSGKSTIARALVGLVPVVGGRIMLDGVDFTGQRARQSRQYRSRVQMVFQDARSSLNPRMTVREALGDALAQRADVPSRQRENQARRALELVGLPASALTRYPHQFSGGQLQRIAIARAIAVRPEVILLDEVTSALDVSVQATLLNLLREIQLELKLSYLLISHDLSVVAHMSDLIAVMYLGRVVERAESGILFSAPQHPYTTSLMQSVPRFGVARPPATIRGDLPSPRRPPTGCRFHTRCPIGPIVHPERQVCRDSDPQAIAAGQPNEAACHFAGTQGALGASDRQQSRSL
jgi:peptide/nickel transport system ATP-binding protein